MVSSYIPHFNKKNIIAREIIMSQKSKWVDRFLDSTGPWRRGVQSLAYQERPGRKQDVSGSPRGWLIGLSLSVQSSEGSRVRGGVAESPVSTERNRWSQEVPWVPVRFPNSCASGRVSKWVEGVFRRGPVVGKRDGLTLPSGAVFAASVTEWRLIRAFC